MNGISIAAAREVNDFFDFAMAQDLERMAAYNERELRAARETYRHLAERAFAEGRFMTGLIDRIAQTAAEKLLLELD